MNKKLLNMERLCEKMHARFGAEDDLVLEFKQELSILREKKRKSRESANFGRRSLDEARAAQVATQ
jgi:hypothetical protein